MALALEKEIKKIYKMDVKINYRRLIEAVPPRPIHDQKEYKKFMKILGFCLEIIEENEISKEAKLGLAEYAKVIGLLIGEYEKKHYPIPRASQAEMLEFLMEQHGLTQNDLKKELGGQSIVSSILHGKRKLNVRQIEKLSKRFQLNPAVFF